MRYTIRMDQNQQKAPRRQSFFPSGFHAFAFGAIGASGFHSLIKAIFRRKSPTSSTEILYVALGGGVAASLMHALGMSKGQTGTIVPPASRTPTAEFDHAPTLALATIPQILDILVANGALKPEQQTHVLTEIAQGTPGAAGDIAIANGFITKEKLDAALGAQAMKKAEAAITDIKNIQTSGTLAAPSWLKANWGNTGVNPTTLPTRADGVSAAANIAQNLVMLANANPSNPQLMQTLFEGVIASAYLANGIALGDNALTPLAKMHTDWQTVMTKALKAGAQANPHLLVDSHGTPINIDDYIAARTTEITAAIDIALKTQPQQSTGQSR